MEGIEDNGEDIAPKRRANGTFAKGSSGNLNGRPTRQPKRHRMPMHSVQAVLDVAEMPVTITVGDKVVETNAYGAAMRKLYQKAVAGEGDMRAMKLFLDNVREAVASNLYHSELVKMLVEKDVEEEEMMKKILERFPASTGFGVHHPIEDGSVVPAKLYESIKKLEQLEAKEEELRKRENAIRAREELLLGK